MPSEYLVQRLSGLVTAVDERGRNGLAMSERQRLAYFFVREAQAGHFQVSDDDTATFEQFVARLRHILAHAEQYAPVNDHKTGLRIDARLIRDTKYPVGALILYATWIEHWINGVVTVRASRRGLGKDDIQQLIRDTPFRSKFSWLLKLLDLPPLADQHRGPILHLADLRNEYLHYKWSGEAARSWGETDRRLKRAIDSAEDHMQYLVTYAVQNIYEPFVSDAERVLGVEYREWMPLFT